MGSPISQLPAGLEVVSFSPSEGLSSAKARIKVLLTGVRPLPTSALKTEGHACLVDTTRYGEMPEGLRSTTHLSSAHQGKPMDQRYIRTSTIRPGWWSRRSRITARLSTKSHSQSLLKRRRLSRLPTSSGAHIAPSWASTVSAGQVGVAMIAVEPPFGAPLTWSQSVMAAHRRWEIRPPPLVAARNVPPPPPPKVQPKTRVAPLEPVASIKPQFVDALGDVDLGQERKKRLTKVSSEPVIQRLMELPPPRRSARDAQGYAGFWSGLHAGKDTASGLGPGLVPKPRRARGVEFANWYAGMHSGRDTQSNLGAGLVPLGEVHKPHEAVRRHTDRGEYTQYSRPKGADA